MRIKKMSGERSLSSGPGVMELMPNGPPMVYQRLVEALVGTGDAIHTVSFPPVLMYQRGSLGSRWCDTIQMTRTRRLPGAFRVFTTFSDETLDVERFF